MNDFSGIKYLFLDVDGTMTDGKMYYGDNGEEMKAFHVHDGMGIKRALAEGLEVCILSGRKSKIVDARAKELGISVVMQGIDDKKEALQLFCENNGITIDAVAYVGDDINDIDIMKSLCITFAPANAIYEAKQHARYILEKKGGDGAVRECIDRLLRAKR